MFKKISIFLLCMATVTAMHAQKFYLGKMKAPVHKTAFRPSFAADTITATPTTQNIFGPVANVASYALTDNSLMMGGGFGYKHMKFDAVKQEWVEVYSINVLAWDKVSLAAQPNKFAYGVAAGFTLGSFYGKGLAGVATTDITQIKKYFPTLGVTLPINR